MDVKYPHIIKAHIESITNDIRKMQLTLERLEIELERIQKSLSGEEQIFLFKD